MLDFKGKHILVTGASSGMGFETAIHLSKIGANIVITGRNPERLDECFSKLENNGHLQIIADLCNTDDILKIFEYIKSNDVRLDGMVHCAGISDVTPIKALTREKLYSIFETNFFSFVELVRQFCNKKYSNDYSSIVAVSAMLVHKPRPYELAYIASKAALEAAIPVIGMEYKKRGLRINAVIPGFVKTAMVMENIEKFGNVEEMNRLAGEFLYGWEEPIDVVKIIGFLMSEDAGIINGRCIYADGGMI